MDLEIWVKEQFEINLGVKNVVVIVDKYIRLIKLICNNLLSRVNYRKSPQTFI